MGEHVPLHGLFHVGLVAVAAAERRVERVDLVEVTVAADRRARAAEGLPPREAPPPCQPNGTRSMANNDARPIMMTIRYTRGTSVARFEACRNATCLRNVCAGRAQSRRRSPSLSPVAPRRSSFAR